MGYRVYVRPGSRKPVWLTGVNQSADRAESRRSISLGPVGRAMNRGCVALLIDH